MSLLENVSLLKKEKKVKKMDFGEILSLFHNSWDYYSISRNSYKIKDPQRAPWV